MNDQNDFIIELQKEFLDEVTFLLEQCEESYLKLENPAMRAEELSTIFRLAHSIKGSGSVVGFHDLAAFAHVVEDCLTILREKPDSVTPEIISLLLQAGDAFKTRVTMLKLKSPEEWDTAALRAEIVAATEALKTGGTVAAPKSMEAQPHEEAAPAPAAPAAEAQPQHHEEDHAAAPAPAAAPAAAHPQAPATVQAHAAPHAHVAPHHDHHKDDHHSKTTMNSVKVDPIRIDAVLDLVGELVVIKSQLLQEHARSTQSGNLRENEVLALLDKTVRDLQDKTLSMRLTSLKPLFLKVQRTVRDLAIKLAKPVEFEMAGEDIEIDRTMIELLNDPLIHIVRNAIDHGIEKAASRKERRKMEKGTISMVARQAGGRIIVEIQDDGGGINRDKVFQKAVKMGIITGNERLTDEEVYDLIFAPGFSTADQVTDVSGRGVGLDVVKSNIKKLKGTIEIESKQGEGSLFKISLPLTTAITEGIVVLIRGIRFVIPMDGIRELLRITEKDITIIKDDQECLSVRGKILPMVRMHSVMYAKALSNSKYSVKDAMATAEEIKDGRNDETVVVIDHLGTLVALTIDGVVGQNQVVVKPLGQHINTTNGIAGAAIMGDGKIALVLDIDGLVRNLKRGSQPEKKPEKKAEKKKLETPKRAVA